MSQSRKSRAIEPLLREPSVAAAAKAIGVNRKTLQRWLREDDFLRELREAKAEAFGLAQGRLCAAANKAVDVLLTGLRGEALTRMQFWCAKSILDAAGQAMQDDLEARVGRLEQIAERQRGSG